MDTNNTGSASDKKAKDDLLNQADSLDIDTSDLRDKKEEEKSEDDKSDKDEADEDEEDESEESDKDDEDESDDEDEDDEDSSRGSRKFIPKHKFDKRNAAHAAEKNTLLSTIAKLTEDLEAAKKSKPPVSSKIQETISKIGVTDQKAAEGLLQLAEAIKEDILSSGGKISEESQNKIDELSKKVDQYEEGKKVEEDSRYFNNSFSGFIPTIEKEYPGITSTQVDEFKKLMDKVWHT